MIFIGKYFLTPKTRRSSIFPYIYKEVKGIDPFYFPNKSQKLARINKIKKKSETINMGPKDFKFESGVFQYDRDWEKNLEHLLKTTEAASNVL